MDIRDIVKPHLKELYRRAITDPQSAEYNLIQWPKQYSIELQAQESSTPVPITSRHLAQKQAKFLSQDRLVTGTGKMSSDSDRRYVTSPAPAYTERAPVSHVLDAAHQSIFQRAVQNVLSTAIAETTFAQIVDGLPLRSVAINTTGMAFHSSIYDHEHLYPGALEKRYQNIPAGSRASKLPLIELVAVVIHRIATLLFKSGNLLEERGLQEDQLCCSDRDETLVYPTPFVLHEYANIAQYPEEGAAELPGYWAEDQVFGGCNSVWLHPFRQNLTHRMCELTEDQLSDLLRFYASERPADWSPPPLPIMVNKKNRRRVEYEIAIPEHNIYRDRWERTIQYIDLDDYEFRRGRTCVIDEDDYPEFEGAQEYFSNPDNIARIENRDIPSPEPPL
ncbi:hypothetical protein VMCG_03258 [Cytospora schulzeri]|uniref:Uncharacterized protein n=1 Tax=Cytospora schulzeri TaxID=448051 RepID=A0A423WY97_9PEZI|nr:hypothetical protein VMCG_03258 [Valsa malicola]